MASFAEKIKITIDVANRNATSALGKFRRDLKSTQGATGKFKVAAAGAFEGIKQNAAGLAMAGGAALVAFGAKAVDAFTDAALAAGRLSNATGLTTEEASQWISVGDDLGISAERIERSFVKAVVEIGKAKPALEEYGIAAVTAADGTVDVNATMLEAIETIRSIEDPTERAALAQETFGRSYAELADLIMDDSVNIVDALESTSDAQIFDQDEVRKAQEYRRVMDEFNDVITDVTMTIGEELTPVITGAVEEVTALKGAFDFLPGGMGRLKDAATAVINPVGTLKGHIFDAKDATEADETFGTLGDSILFTGDASEELAEEVEETASEMSDATRAAMALSDAQRDLDSRMRAATRSIQRQKDELSDRSAYLSAHDGLRDIAAQAVTTGDVTEQQVIDMKQSVLDYGLTLDNVGQREYVARISALIDQGSYFEAENLLKLLERARTSTIRVNYVGPSGPTAPTRSGVPNAALASGTPYAAPGSYLVGEEGPEIVNLGHGDSVTPNGRSMDVMRGTGRAGQSVNVTYNFPAGTRPVDVTKAERDWRRIQGPR